MFLFLISSALFAHRVKGQAIPRDRSFRKAGKIIREIFRFEIEHFAALFADHVFMATARFVVPRGSARNFDFSDLSVTFHNGQVPVYRSFCDVRHPFFCFGVNFLRRRMPRGIDDLPDDLSLFRHNFILGRSLLHALPFALARCRVEIFEPRRNGTIGRHAPVATRGKRNAADFYPVRQTGTLELLCEKPL